jgi:hypothetical protein
MAGAIRVRQGEFAHVIDGPGGPAPLATVFAVGDALRMIKDAAREPAAATSTELAPGSRARGDATSPHRAERTALVAGAGVSHAAADLRSHERHAFPQEARRRVAQVDPGDAADSAGADG